MYNREQVPFKSDQGAAYGNQPTWEGQGATYGNQPAWEGQGATNGNQPSWEGQGATYGNKPALEVEMYNKEQVPFMSDQGAMYREKPTFEARAPSPYQGNPGCGVQGNMGASQFPTAPPTMMMNRQAEPDNPPGYHEVIGSGPVCHPANMMSEITEREARQALMKHVAEHCCWGPMTARHFVYHQLKHLPAYKYTLQTYKEARSIEWAYNPYTGQDVDGPENGSAPELWDVPVETPEPFVDHVQTVRVPYTGSVVACNDCSSTGKHACSNCRGKGGSCSVCEGSGEIVCNLCRGHGILLKYQKLTVTWNSLVTQHVVNKSELPTGLLHEVTGVVAFQDQQPLVSPISYFQEPEIYKASYEMPRNHSADVRSKQERSLMQRHKVQTIPVAQALYFWRGILLDFYVYGQERKVHAPHYPEQVCGGCDIL